MTEKCASVHPLFDPSSLYGRMRACARAEDKMRGYFHWLWARAKQEPQSLPHQRSPSEGADGAVRLWDQGTVLDVWPAQATLVAAETDCLADALLSGEISLYLIREVDGRHTLGCRVQLSQWPGRREELGLWLARHGPCRAFLLEPEVVERLKSLLPEKPWQEALSAQTVASNPDVARVFAAAPEMEGELHAGEILFERLAVPESYSTFPPRQQPLQVVIACATTSRATLDDIR
jgi:hypothetical protein